MRIGITVDIRHSMFSAGHPNSSIAIYEVFVLGGHDVTLIHKETDREWWDDVKELQIPCIHIDKINSLDMIIEVGFHLSALQRKTLCNKAVWYCRSPCIFRDIESYIYMSKTYGRDLEGISEIWVADIFNFKDDSIYLKLLYPSIQIKTVSWLWTSQIVEKHRELLSSPVWIQVSEQIPPETPWSLHISESNTSNTSSCTLPLVILQNSYSMYNLPIKNVNVHNSEIISKSKFFNENILNNCKIKDIEFNFVGRQRIIDWSYDPHSVILSHSRFTDIKMANLEAVWVGLPIVHNSKILRDLGYGLELLYYEGNNVSKASMSLNKIINDTKSIPYLNDLNVLTSLRNEILRMFSPEANVKEWNDLLLQEDQIEKPFTILFTDMWDNFNENHNMFTLALEKELNMKVRGYSLKTMPSDFKQDIHIFGPFGNKWKSISGPKIHFTGENTEPVLHKEVKLNIGFKHTDNPNYMRIPLWMFEIDWFGADLKKITNPIPLPVEVCLKPPVTDRKKFCAFIVSNPRNLVRNEAFNILNKYKQVDSAGWLYNNVGDIIFAGKGGGGGELKKHEFLKDYRFCIAYENNSSDGYTTEKLLHAKAAGCVPIYWGDPSVSEDFDERGFINLSDNSTLLERVKDLEENPAKWSEMASIPAITPEKKEYILETFQKMAKRVYAISKEISEIPLFVTYASQKFWPYLGQWILSLETNRISIGSVKADVYVASDITDSMIEVYRKKYNFVNFIRVPSETPEGFPEFWNPEHFAWKIWICNTISKGHGLIFYMDCASILIRWPTEWIKEAIQNKISFLNDSGQYNKQWCHEEFCKILQVTDDEKRSHQIAACLFLFVAGDKIVKEFFSEAYKLACIKDVIVGQKWSGLDKDENNYGHRHDQSIMSILSDRYKINRYPLEKIYNHISARSTYYNGQCVYVHRGDYKTHVPLLEGIDDAYVVNLDRRQDRRKAFIDFHPDLKGHVRRHAAFDGKQLRFTPLLGRLFKPNDFFWKKAVMGCALSHLKLWTMLLNDSKEIKSYLIMEDDARLSAGWKDTWKAVYPKLPKDWECIYLGGVLPPNKEGFKSVLEPVIPGLSRIAPNTFFGQSEPTRQFHFCTYAYVISRAGVNKLLNSIIEKNGIWTSIDHVLFNSLDKMNVYVMDPLMAGASQDDDPIYINSDFNDFSRLDNFDSDLWNNDERFSQGEVIRCSKNEINININETLNELYIVKPPVRIICLDKAGMSNNTIYEGPWLQELFGSVPFTMEVVTKDTCLESYDNLIIALIRPEWEEQIKWLESICRIGKTFKILHFSDEFIADPVFFYEWPQITNIIRFYKRSEIVNSKVLTIPLGYHWPSKKMSIDQRKYIWSFVGTNWKNRSDQLSPLTNIEPNKVIFYSDWNHPTQLSQSEYIELLYNSVFVPCPRGNNIETYRFYEALECGCIPVFTEFPEILLESKIPFILTPTWDDVVRLITYFSNNTRMMEEYRKEIFDGWNRYKAELKDKISLIINVA